MATLQELETQVQTLRVEAATAFTQSSELVLSHGDWSTAAQTGAAKAAQLKRAETDLAEARDRQDLEDATTVALAGVAADVHGDAFATVAANAYGRGYGRYVLVVTVEPDAEDESVLRVRFGGQWGKVAPVRLPSGPKAASNGGLWYETDATGHQSNVGFETQGAYVAAYGTEHQIEDCKRDPARYTRTAQAIAKARKVTIAKV